MTTFQVVDGHRDESRSEAAARRLRGALAELRISISEVARRIDMTQGALSRRMTGHVEFTLDLIDQICEATGISFTYITTGIKETPASPDGPDGGLSGSAPSRARTYDLRITSPSVEPSPSVEMELDAA